MLLITTHLYGDAFELIHDEDLVQQVTQLRTERSHVGLYYIRRYSSRLAQGLWQGFA